MCVCAIPDALLLQSFAFNAGHLFQPKQNGILVVFSLPMYTFCFVPLKPPKYSCCKAPTSIEDGVVQQGVTVVASVK